MHKQSFIERPGGPQKGYGEVLSGGLTPYPLISITITQTITKSNLPLTQSNFCFPSDLFNSSVLKAY